MTHVDARGDACPLPVVKAKRAISELKGAGQVEILVDNEIAVQNLTRMPRRLKRPRPSACRTPAWIPWWPLEQTLWVPGPRSWARPCSRRSCLP